MRIDHRVVWAVCVPLAALTTLLFSAGGQLIAPDGPPRGVVGFPFLWAVEGPNSLSLTVALPALLVDYLLYLLFTIALVASFARWTKWSKIAAVSVWLVALAMVWLHWSIVTVDSMYVWWIERDAQSSIVDYRPRLFSLVFSE